MSNSFTSLMPTPNAKETLAGLSAIAALVPLVFEVLQILLDVEILNTTTALAGVPSSLIVSSVAGLVTMTLGFLIVKTHAPAESLQKSVEPSKFTHTEVGTWLFRIGLAVTFVATVIISTIGGY